MTRIIMPADRFIPFRKQDIVEMCRKELPNSHDSDSFKQFSDLLSSYIHFDYHSVLESLKNDYAPFDPNADTRLLNALSDEQKRQCQQSFATNFANVLNAANYEKITEQDLQDALTEESLFKVRLEVEFEDFEQVVFYRRGESQKSETLRSFFGLRKQLIEFTNYDRVAVFITLKDASHFSKKNKAPVGFEPGSTIIKLFQNVPKADLEMLFPNSEVRMRRIDKVLIGASAAVGGSVVLATKLGPTLLLLAALFGFWLGLKDTPVQLTKQHLLTIGMGFGVLGGFIFKEWSKFKNRKIKFMKALSDNLYFKNLDNNAGVFHTLIDSAEEEDVKEALLAYTFLLKNPAGLNAAELDKTIENWFEQTHKCKLDFEIEDALDKLERMELVSKSVNFTKDTVADEQQAIFVAKPLKEAKQQLDKKWDNIFNYNIDG